MRIKMRSQFVSKQFKIHNLKFKEVKTLQELTRPNIWKLKPYSSARDEYKGVTASVFLDANENPYNTPHNRYPDPMPVSYTHLTLPEMCIRDRCSVN